MASIPELLEALSEKASQNTTSDPPVLASRDLQQLRLRAVPDERVLAFLGNEGGTPVGKARLAVRLHRVDSTWVAVSDKWSNILFDLKATVTGLGAAAASGAAALGAGGDVWGPGLTLAAISAWRVLSGARKIRLNEDHATLLSYFFAHADQGMPVTSRHTLTLEQLLGPQRVGQALRDLEDLAIIERKSSTGSIRLRERLLVVAQDLLISESRLFDTGGEAQSPAPPEDEQTSRDRVLEAIEAWGKFQEGLGIDWTRCHESHVRDMLAGALSSLPGALSVTTESSRLGGRTDILIQAGSKSILVCECKIWEGPKSFHDAMKQVLGYSIWRDRALALIFFVQNQDIGAVRTKALEALTAYPSRRGAVQQSRGEQTLRAELTNPHDRSQGLALSVFLFQFEGRSRGR